jgi:two-component system, sensor histidine kinase
MNDRLLIADDEHDSAESLAMLLRLHSFQVAVAFDGREAVDVATAFDPEYLILDLNMPALNGFQVAHYLRSLPQFSRKHFIALTAYSDQRNLDAASHVKFDEYLIKPCKIDSLMKILSETPDANCSLVQK